MILAYHKVAPKSLSEYWVSVAAFKRQMAGLAGRRVVHLDCYDPADPDACVITFDDAYANVLHYAAPIMAEHGFPFEVFVNGGLIGKWNTFDQPAEPPVRICTKRQLHELVAAGARLQWHTLSHKNLAEANLAETLAEIRVRKPLTAAFPPPHFRWFSYPYGAIGEAALRAARVLFDGAVGVQYLADRSDRHRLPRIEMFDDTDTTRLRHDPPPPGPDRRPEDLAAEKAASCYALMSLVEQGLRDFERPYPGQREWLRSD